MKELWKDITDSKGYKVSNLGRVRNNEGELVKGSITNSGYRQVSVPGIGNTLVHRLVAREFCEGYKKELTVNHKDANRLNNKAENLEWVTYQENIHDTFRRGTGDTHTAREVLSGKVKKQVRQIDPDSHQILHTYNSIKEAEKTTGIIASTITRVASGERKTAGGYVWEYVEKSDRGKHKKVSVESPQGDIKVFDNIRSAARAYDVPHSRIYYHLGRAKKPYYELEGNIWRLVEQ